MTAKKPKAKKPAPRKPVPKTAPTREVEPRDAADDQIYRDGRDARSSSIPRDSSPHPKGKLRDLWQEGWDFQDEAMS